MTMRTSTMLALLLGLGALMLAWPNTHAASSDGMGNCYSDGKDYSTPTLCE